MNNYIEVTIGGKARGLKFNNLSVEVYAKKINFESVGATAIYATFYAGLCGNCYVKRVEEDFTFEEVCDWVDELHSKDAAMIKKVCDLFEQTQVYKEWLKNFQDKIRAILDPTDKKKVRAKRR